MRYLVLLLILFISAQSFAGTTRRIEADSIRSSDTTKTYTLPAASGTVMISAGLVQEVPSGTINGSNTSFSLTYAPAQAASVMLFRDGLILSQGGGNDYTISGSTITMVSAPTSGQSLLVVYSRY